MLLNTKTAQTPLAPVGVGSNFGEVVALKGGGFMAVWVQQVLNLLPVDGADDESATAIFGRVFNASGKPKGDVFQINDKTDGFQDKPDVTVLKNGNVVVVWDDGPGFTDFDVDAKAAIIAPDGSSVKEEFSISSLDAGEQRIPHVAPTSNGGFQVAWAGPGSSDRWETLRFDRKGNAVGDEVPLDIYGGSDGKLLYLNEDTKVLAGTGPNIFVWQDQVLADGSFARIVDSDRLVLPGEGYSGFDSDMEKVDQDSFAILRQDDFDLTLSFHTVGDNNPLSSTETTGRASVKTDSPADPSARYDQSVKLWTHAVDSPIAGTPSLPTFARPEAELVPLAGGDLLALYAVAIAGSTEFDLKYALYAQLVSSDGSLLGDRHVIEEGFTFSAGGQIIRPFGSQGANGDIFIGWTTNTDRNGDGTVELTGGTYELKYPSKTAARKINEKDNEIFGSKVANRIDPKGGNDVVFGLGGADIIDASEGQNKIYAGSGDDIIVMSSFSAQSVLGLNDALVDAGSGTDRLDLRDMPEGVWTSGSNFVPAGAFAAETRNFEQVVATEYDDRVSMVAGFNNTNNINQAWLLGGDDEAEMFRGEQRVDGGKGFDRATFNFVASTDVTIRETKKAVIVSYVDETFPQNSFEHRLTAFEELYFGFDATVIPVSRTASEKEPDAPGFGGLTQINGNANNNTLKGGSKSERIDGKGGADVLEGRNGADQLFGGSGSDKGDGGAGLDLLDGGAGNDTLRGGNDTDTVRGGAGNDRLFGDAGDDKLSGGAGKDKLNGGDGRDNLDGGAGDDTLIGGDFDDVIVFGKGFGKDLAQDFDSDFSTGLIGRDIVQFKGDLFDEVLTAQQVIDTYGSIKGGNAVFKFSKTDVLTLADVSDLAELSFLISIDYT